MYRLKYFLLALCGAVLASCSWVKDDLSDCPTGVWLQLEYIYNMLDVDAAESQISEADIFVYDSEGHYVRQQHVTKPELQANNYRVELKDLAEGTYNFVVWAGLSDSRYMGNGSVASDAFRLSLTTKAQQVMDEELGALFFGKIDSIHIDNKYAVHHVPMMKDTNHIACIVESEDEGASVNTNVYTMELIADNSVLDAGNTIVAREQIHYLPFEAQDIIIDDQEFGERHAAQFDISTLRLMQNDNARLVLKLVDTDYEVFNIPVSQYIAQVASLYEIRGKQLSAQEYLDRQDLFTFVFCLSPGSNTVIRCMVNNWVVRSKELVISN